MLAHVCVLPHSHEELGVLALGLEPRVILEALEVLRIRPLENRNAAQEPEQQHAQAEQR